MRLTPNSKDLLGYLQKNIGSGKTASEKAIFDAITSILSEKDNTVQKAIADLEQIEKQNVNNDCAQNALFLLGIFCKYEIGFTKNIQKMNDYFNKAAKMGHALSLCMEGIHSEQGVGVAVDLKKAIDLYNQSAQKGCVIAKYILSVCHRKGRGVVQNVESADKCYAGVIHEILQGVQPKSQNTALRHERELTRLKLEKGADLVRVAALLGYTGDLYTVGSLYEHFDPIKNIKKATETYRLAACMGDVLALKKLEDLASQGIVEANCALGLFYADGNQKNIKKMLDCFLKAADKNDAEARYHLGGYCVINLTVEVGKKQAFEYLYKAARQGYYRAYHMMAYLFFNGIYVQKDIQQAIEHYKTAAENGHIKSQANLTVIFSNEIETPVDMAVATQYAEMAADQGDIECQNFLGAVKHAEGVKNNDELCLKDAAFYFLRAAKQGCAKSHLQLGIFYENEIGVPKIIKKAVLHYQISAKQGNNIAKYALSILFGKGKGVELNLKKSAELFKEVIDSLGFRAGDIQNHKKIFDFYLETTSLGHTAAYSKIGFAYEQGSGVARSLEKAVAYYYAAMQKEGDPFAKERLEFLDSEGYLEAGYVLGMCYSYGMGVAQTVDLGIFYICKAIELGSINAKLGLEKIAKEGNCLANYKLATYHESGVWFKKDLKISLEYMKAAAKKYVLAQRYLGLYYFRNTVFVQYQIKAIYYLRLAAKQNDAIALDTLAICYKEGYGVCRDPKKACELFHQAADLGNTHAQQMLFSSQNSQKVKAETPKATKGNRMLVRKNVQPMTDAKIKVEQIKVKEDIKVLRDSTIAAVNVVTVKTHSLTSKNTDMLIMSKPCKPSSQANVNGVVQTRSVCQNKPK